MSKHNVEDLMYYKCLPLRMDSVGLYNSRLLQLFSFGNELLWLLLLVYIYISLFNLFLYAVCLIHRQQLLCVNYAKTDHPIFTKVEISFINSIIACSIHQKAPLDGQTSYNLKFSSFQLLAQFTKKHLLMVRLATTWNLAHSN